MADVSATRLPFAEQAEFWRRKVNVPTATWRDLQRDDHAHGFMVAGAARQDLLDDLRKAVDKAVLDGATIADFRRDFDGIVARTGWQYNGGRNWRTRIIYDTNIRSAYMAGRWQQMQAIKHRRPYWEYVHNDAVHPRPQHLAWNGTILSADDPWWSTHFAPNGYGCHCTVNTLAPRDLESRGKSGPDQAPTTVEDTDGIDPGFEYNVGVAARSMPAAVRFGQKLMTLPSAWRDSALADAQRRPTDLFADWSGTVRRVIAETEDGVPKAQATAHAVGFMPPDVATALLDGQGVGGAFAAPSMGTALLGVQDTQLYHALRVSKGPASETLHQALDELPRRLADPATVALWDSAPDGQRNASPALVYAWPIGDGRYVRWIFGLEASGSGSVLRKAKLRANWLRTVGIVERYNLAEPRYTLLQGQLESKK